MTSLGGTERVARTSPRRFAARWNRFRILVLKILRSINNMNRDYIQNLSSKNTRSKRRPNDLINAFHNTVAFGEKGIKVLGAHIWNICLHI